jgi:hypothetical protein
MVVHGLIFGENDKIRKACLPMETGAAGINTYRRVDGCRDRISGISVCFRPFSF